MMCRILLRLLFILGSVQLANAQSTFVQVEARPTLAQAENRARAYASALPDVVGFSLRSGWYALALGPYTETEAQRRLANLRAAGIIPSDSYLTDRARYRQQFWPVAGSAAIVPQQPTTALPQTPTPVVDIDETPREARASERLLTREERVELQRLLQWFGFYNASLDGAFGPGTRGSMAAWQTANNFEATGILTTKQRAQLAKNTDGQGFGPQSPRNIGSYTAVVVLRSARWATNSRRRRSTCSGCSR